MIKLISSLYTSFSLLGISILLSLSSSNNFLLPLKLGLLLGSLAAISLVFNVLTSKNFNFLILSCSSFLLFSFLGFYTSISTVGWNEISSYFSKSGYRFEFEDIRYSCVYSAIFVISFCLIESKVRYHRSLIKKNLEIIFNNFRTYRSHMLLYAFTTSLLKIYLLVSGTVSFSFTGVQENLQEYGGAAGTLVYMILGLSGSNMFIIALLLAYRENRPKYIEFLLLIPEIVFALSQGRRSLLSNALIFGFAAYTASSLKKENFTIGSDKLLSSIRFSRGKLRKLAKPRTLFKLIAFASSVWLAITLLSYFRYNILYLGGYDGDLIFSFVRYAFGGEFMSDLINGNKIVQEANSENLSIRGAFYLAYLAHTIHGLLEYGNTSNGGIIISSIFQSIPSALGLVDKSKLLEGEEIIGRLVNTPIADGSNNLVVFSFADFMFLGPVIYPLILVLIVFGLLKLVHSVSRRNSLISVLCISSLLYYSCSFSEISWTDLFLSFRSTIIVLIICLFCDSFSNRKFRIRRLG